MYDIEDISNSTFTTIPEDEEDSFGENKPTETEKKSIKSKKSKKSSKKGRSTSTASSDSSDKSSKKSRSSSTTSSDSYDSKSSRKKSSKPKKEKKQSHKSKVKQSRSKSKTGRRSSLRAQPEQIMPRRKVKKEVSFDDLAVHVVEPGDDVMEAERLWWTKTELEAIAEENSELCIALQHEEEYVWALQMTYSSGDVVSADQQQAMRILLKYDDVGRGLEQRITQEDTNERIGQHRHATLEAMYRVQRIAKHMPRTNTSGVNQLKLSCSRFVSGLSGTFSRSSQNMAIIGAEIDARHAFDIYCEE